jgi:hypothetical protein
VWWDADEAVAAAREALEAAEEKARAEVREAAWAAKEQELLARWEAHQVQMVRRGIYSEAMASMAHRLPAWMREERPAAREAREAREREAAVGELLQAMCDSVQMANEPLMSGRLPPAPAEEALRMWSLFMRGTLELRDGSLEFVSESDEDE